MDTPPDITALDRLLVHVAHLHRDRARTLFNTIGLYRGQPPVLRYLEEQPGLSHSELAARLGVRPATVSKMLDRMEKSGFIMRQPDPTDQRVSRVYLTEQGVAVQGRMVSLFNTMARDISQGFTPQDVAQLHDLLMRVADNLERASTQEPQPSI